MLRVFGCITQQHDLRLVVLAALICCLACFTAINMLWRASHHRRLVAGAWLAGAAFVFGCGVWATHFIAMLAFRSDLILGYEPARTILSLAVVCIGALLAFWLFLREPPAPPLVLVAGILLGSSIAAMHYIGVAAMRFQGIATLDPSYITPSILLSVSLASLGLFCARRLDSSLRRILGCLCLTAAVVALHFTGMTGLTILSLALEPRPGLLIGSGVLGGIVITVSTVILLFSLFGSLVDQHLAWRTAREAHGFWHMAHHDALTGLPNRVRCLERLDQMVASARNNQEIVAVLCLDLDRFKHVNDLLGHQAGDLLLSQVAERLRALVRSTDLVARISGDEFVVAVPPPVTAEAAGLLALRLVETLAETFVLEGQQASIGASVGVACCPADGTTAADLLCNADTALYQAKAEGRGAHRLFDASMNERIRTRHTLEQDLRRAIHEGQLELHYQPLLDLRAMEITGFEALIRWNHPERGRISPSDFIPMAEQSGLIMPLGRWVLETACREAASWDKPLPISVNLSPRQFYQADLVATVEDTLHRSGLPPGRLELEITESAVMHHTERTLETINHIRALGISIALDDFGTGYSSLNYLRLYPFSKIKIDQSFIQSIGQNDEAAVIIRAIIALGHGLSLRVTAEGVETNEQFAFLLAEDCDHVQGYLVGKPAPAHEIAYLTRRLPDRALAASQRATAGAIPAEALL